jgi:shikimate kinase/3-dehydroquinate synthase
VRNTSPGVGNLVFIGFMGAGKTSAARSVAAELGVRAIDADAAIERHLGASIEDWFSRHGERAFRETEEDVVCELLDGAEDAVISLGGGAVLSERVQEALGGHTVVHLDVEPDAAWQRAGGRRPLARDRRRFDELHASRAPLYEALADAVVPHADREAVRAAIPAIRSLAEAPRDTKLVWAKSASGAYPVYAGPGLLGSGFWPVAGSRFCVTDENVGERYAAGLGEVAHVVTVPPGETQKSMATAELVLRELARAGLDHDGHVVALGGGVVGDLAGFCAAVYQRGVRVVQAPTTLVAQVDSAYGGKTGVDLPEGKNYAGAYHQPSAVMVDPSVLETLPPAELAAGWAEVIKTALIAGGALWKRVSSGPATIDRNLLLACVRTKLAVVAEDERDAGRRQSLNLGHTIGHAIETVTGYARYRHGEAVGLGLLAALSLSEAHGLRAEVADLLAARDLPTRLDRDVDRAAVREAVARDKKRRSGRVGFVLLERPGLVRTGRAVSEPDLRAALEELADG